MYLLNVETNAAQIKLLTNYTFTDKLLAAEAVQMAAPNVAVIYGSLQGLPNSKRLSVLGDAILAKVLRGFWFNARDRSGTKTYQLSPNVQQSRQRTQCKRLDDSAQ